eukprot:SAG31_NODE_5109_length_2739_cov_2.238636_3_plen_309_part_00
MSSLAASRADNFYHPPEWDPRKVARDKYQGSKGSNQWEQYGVIRFEMPYNIWCGGCSKHIRKGTRFNAKKDTVGTYHSTKIYAFTMKCACCPQKIVIETDPKNCDYVVVSGGRRKIETYSETDAEVERLATDDEKIKIASDPFYKLEHQNRDEAAVRESKPRLSQLIDLRFQQGSDDFSMSQKLRQQMRQRKKQDSLPEQLKKGAATAGVRLLPETDEDKMRARLVEFKRSRCNRSAFQKNLIAKRVAISAGSIFGAGADDASTTALVKLRTRGVDPRLFIRKGTNLRTKPSIPPYAAKLVPRKSGSR